jgi:hypothetical protein
VATGPGDPSVGATDKNTVTQVDVSSGAVVDTYSVSAPRAIAVLGDGALVAAGGVGSVPTTVLHLHDGKTDTSATVPGLLASNPGFSGPALVVCGSSLYVATHTDGRGTDIYASPLSGGGSHKLVTVPASGVGSLACSDQTLLLAVKSPDHGGVFRVSVADSVVRKSFGPLGVSDLAVVGGRLWVVDQGFDRGAAGFIYVFELAGEIPISTLQLPPGDSRLMVGGPTGAWVIAGSRLLNVVGK